MIQRRIKVLPKQREFLTAPEFEVLYSGAVRAGKTYALCLATAMRASVPHAREILCRKTLSALKGTTLKTLLEGDGYNPPVLPPGTYTHNRSEKQIKILGGGEIVYFALVNDGDSGVQQRAGSYSGTGVNIDEATELDEGDYKMLLSRASITIDGVRKQVRSACNPSTPSHFLAKRFAPPGSGESKPMANCRCIATHTNDNTFLAPDVLELLNRDAGSLWHRRFVQGIWCGSEGLVYDNFDRAVHVRERARDEFKRWIICCDDGVTNPFVALLLGVDEDGRVHVAAEHYAPGLLTRDKVGAVHRLVQLTDAEAAESIVVDPSAAALIAEMRDADLHIRKANNEMTEGIYRVQSRLALAVDGRPRLTIDPSCVNMLREFETYSWKPDRPKDEPIKKHDHTMDALRYGIAVLDAGVGSCVVLATLGARAELPAGAEDERLWSSRGWTFTT